ncbi:MAG: hypothetical protein ACR2LL_07660 [Nitrosopumilus sp.]|nr:hypothetical protein [Nitrosopumilus sp.]
MFSDVLVPKYSPTTPPIIDEEKGYYVDEIADGIYWLVRADTKQCF